MTPGVGEMVVKVRRCTIVYVLKVVVMGAARKIIESALSPLFSQWVHVADCTSGK